MFKLVLGLSELHFCHRLPPHPTVSLSESYNHKIPPPFFFLSFFTKLIKMYIFGLTFFHIWFYRFQGNQNVCVKNKEVEVHCKSLVTVQSYCYYHQLFHYIHRNTHLGEKLKYLKEFIKCTEFLHKVTMFVLNNI